MPNPDSMPDELNLSARLSLLLPESRPRRWRKIFLFDAEWRIPQRSLKYDEMPSKCRAECSLRCLESVGTIPYDFFFLCTDLCVPRRLVWPVVHLRRVLQIDEKRRASCSGPPLTDPKGEQIFQTFRVCRHPSISSYDLTRKEIHKVSWLPRWWALSSRDNGVCARWMTWGRCTAHAVSIQCSMMATFN